MADMQDLVITVIAIRIIGRFSLDVGQYRVTYRMEGLGIGIEQIARVGSPLPRAIMRRRQRGVCAIT